MQLVPEEYHDLISEEVKAIAYVSTILSNGTPITAPVWFGIRDNFICFVTSPNSIKFKNLLERPQVSVLIQDPNNTYRYLQLRGKYAKHDTTGSADYLHMLSNRYIGKDYPTKLGGEDVIVYITPERVNVFSWEA